MLKVSTKFPLLHTAVPKPKVDFFRELISTKIAQPKEVLSISDVINMSKDMSDFKENLSVLTKENIRTIEKLTMSQSENEHWCEYRKCLITASKAHNVFTKMTKIEKVGGGAVNMRILNQKISGLVFAKPNITSLKYVRDMEIEAANTFIEFIKGKYTDIKFSDCGLFVDETLPYVSASPDRLLLCSCCEKACVEIKCRYSINCTEPCYSNLEYLRRCNGKTVLKTSHKYYTQCMLQMAVTRTMENYFVVWTPHEMIIDQIFFDNEFWCSMKNKSQKYYEHFLRPSFNG